MHVELTLVLLIPAEQLQYWKCDSPLGSLYPFRLVHTGTMSLSLNGDICITCSTRRFCKLIFSMLEPSSRLKTEQPPTIRQHALDPERPPARA